MDNNFDNNFENIFEDKIVIKESLEKQLENHFNKNEIGYELSKSIDPKPCMLLCCLPFTILLSPCVCYYYYNKYETKKEEEQKRIENNIKYLELKKSTKYQIEYIEKEIQYYKLMVSNMKIQIPNSLYKIELLEEKLNKLKDEKENEKE